MTANSIQKYDEKTLSFIAKAADAGDLEAQVELGKHYGNLDTEKSIHYYRLAADRGHPLACISLANILSNQGKPAEAVKYIVKTIDEKPEFATYMFRDQFYLGVDDDAIDKFLEVQSTLETQLQNEGMAELYKRMYGNADRILPNVSKHKATVQGAREQGIKHARLIADPTKRAIILNQLDHESVEVVFSCSYGPEALQRSIYGVYDKDPLLEQFMDVDSKLRGGDQKTIDEVEEVILTTDTQFGKTGEYLSRMMLYARVRWAGVPPLEEDSTIKTTIPFKDNPLKVGKKYFLHGRKGHYVARALFYKGAMNGDSEAMFYLAYMMEKRLGEGNRVEIHFDETQWTDTYAVLIGSEKTAVEWYCEAANNGHKGAKEWIDGAKKSGDIEVLAYAGRL
jgi:TPR repeat protein